MTKFNNLMEFPSSCYSAAVYKNDFSLGNYIPMSDPAPTPVVKGTKPRVC